MSEFSGQEFDFAVGAVKGLRGWGMDEVGRLHGVTHREVWRPGENVSVCKKEQEAVPCPQFNRREEARRASEAGRAQVASKKKRKRRDDPDFVTFHISHSIEFTPRTPCGDPTCVRGEYHTVPTGHRFDPACQCGFWAYDEAGFTPHGSVVGVIEGYGKVTVGTKGFRAEKARIVGLCENGTEGKRHSRSVLSRLATLYPDAAWYQDTDEMIGAHPEVLRDWPAATDEGFWLQPVPNPERDQWRALQRQMLSHYSLPNRWYLSGGVV